MTPIRRARRAVQFRWRIIAGTIVPIFSLMVRLRIRKSSRLPSEGPFIISPNHYSEIDPIVMGVAVWKLGRIPRFLAKASLFRVPLLGWLMRFSGQIPVERRSKRAAGNSLEKLRGLMLDREGIIVYPEGTLTRDPEMWPMEGKSGAIRLALEENIPIYPAAHWGTQDWMGRYAKKIRLFPRTQIEVVVGEPLDLSRYRARALSSDLLREATKELMIEISKLVGKLRNQKPPEKLFAVEQGGGRL